jgi:4-amino-4-deoxy-L-arabinose transferase-like glycosyltransferase
MKRYKTFILSIFILLIGTFFWYSYFKFVTPGYLTFSDGAKYADIARNIVNGHGYKQTFSFFSPNLNLNSDAFPSTWSSPAMPYTLVLFYKLLGSSDFSVYLTSFVLYLLLVLTVYLLGRKMWGDLTGFLAALFVAVNINILDYATSAASETLFLFLAVLVPLLILYRNKLVDSVAAILLMIMYFTRPQAVIFIIGYLLFWLLLHFKIKKALLIFTALIISGILVDHFVLTKMNGQFHLYSILNRGSYEAVQYTSDVSTSDALRGASPVIQQDRFVMLKKIFYNLYNFYRSMPQILSPYLFLLFLIGLFKIDKKDQLYFKIVTAFIVLATFLGSAATIPFYRYLHPVIPLVYLIAAATLIWIMEIVLNIKNAKQWQKRQLQFVIILIGLLVAVGQTVGVIFLDSRFTAKSLNIGKPPVYVALARTLKNNSLSTDNILTNLDTWGSWYGERKTVWFPLKPDQLALQTPNHGYYDVIYLTNYLIDDTNYYMGEEWRQTFNNPENLQNEYLKDNYVLKDTYIIPASEVYENEQAKAILLIRKP